MFPAVVVAVILLPGAAGAQQQSAAIRGAVLDAASDRVPGAAVLLLDSLGFEVAATTTDAGGRFVFESVAPGTYTLLAEGPSQRSAAHVISVQTALSIDLELRLAARAAETVIVESVAERASVTTRTTLAGAALRQMPTRLRSRALHDALATLPGWAAEDNGLLHVRGVDDGFLYVQDGVPVYDRVDALFGITSDPAGVATIQVLTGYIPPEFGLKSGAVIEVHSSAPQESDWAGSVDVGIGSDGATSTRAHGAGPLGRRFSVGGSIAAERSRWFLDAVHPDNLHNLGGVLSGNARASLAVSDGDLVRVDIGTGRSRFQVPHGAEQEDAGQDQRQRLAQHAQSGSWQHFWSDDTVSQLAVHRRGIDARLRGSPYDTPLSTTSDRRQERAGLLASIARQAGGHTVKSGIDVGRLSIREAFGFAVTDDEDHAEDAGLSAKATEFTTTSPFHFQDRARRLQWSWYAQDQVRASNDLTLDFGIRFDRTRLLLAASQWSPRAGAAYRWPATGTTVRASINRLFQPPQPEHLLLSSSPAARALSPFVDGQNDDEDEDEINPEARLGGAEIAPERQTAWQAGVEQWLAGVVRLDAEYWRRHVRNYSDPNVFFGTTIVFPNSVARGRAEGVDVRLEVPRYRGWSTYLSYTNSRVVQVGPINGGLFLAHDTLAIGHGTAFVPDHDQRHVAAGGLSYERAEGGFSASLTGRYGSGTPMEIEEDDEEELARRPGAALADFDRGRVRPRMVFDVGVAQSLRQAARAGLSVRLTILNVTNRAYAFNFGNPFSGTHFGAPRTARLELRLDVH